MIDYAFMLDEIINYVQKHPLKLVECHVINKKNEIPVNLWFFSLQFRSMKHAVVNPVYFISLPHLRKLNYLLPNRTCLIYDVENELIFYYV
jgi:hypothetical protein